MNSSLRHTYYAERCVTSDITGPCIGSQLSGLVDWSLSIVATVLSMLCSLSEIDVLWR